MGPIITIRLVFYPCVRPLTEVTLGLMSHSAGSSTGYDPSLDSASICQSLRYRPRRAMKPSPLTVSES